MCRSWVSVISSMRWCTSSISARSLFNSLNIVSQKTSRSNTSISSLRCVHVNWRRRKIYKRRGKKHRQMGYLLIGGLISTKGNWINISTVRSGPFLEKRNNLNPSGLRLTNRVNVFHRPHFRTNEMPVLWEEDGMPVCIDSDTRTFVLCCVVCLLDWWEDWGWRVMNWWQEGHWLQTTGPIIKGSKMPQVHGDWYYQRKSRLQRARDQLCPCQ